MRFDNVAEICGFHAKQARAQGFILEVIPVPVVILAVVAAYAIILLNFTPLGRHIYAIGGNREAALLSGVPVKRVLVFTYAISGALAGLGGVITASQLKSSDLDLVVAGTEVAVLMEQKVDKVMALRLFGMVRKGQVSVLARAPLKLEVVEGKEPGTAYETEFAKAIKGDGKIDDRHAQLA